MAVTTSSSAQTATAATAAPTPQTPPVIGTFTHGLATHYIPLVDPDEVRKWYNAATAAKMTAGFYDPYVMLKLLLPEQSRELTIFTVREANEILLRVCAKVSGLLG